VTGPLASTAWLRGSLGDARLRVVDSRFVLGEPGAAERLWRESHIPGAAFLDVDRDLASAPGEGGRHPLPRAEDSEAAARRAGIGHDTFVVAYDEAAEGGAARLWWLLRHFGHEEVAVLDGGLRAWREEGGPLRAGEEEIEPGTFTARPREGDTATAEEIAGEAATTGPADSAEPAGSPDSADSADSAGSADAAGAGAPVLLDARAPERYRGEVEPIDPVAGRIPGARNLPFAEVAPGGRFLEPDELCRRFAAAGAAAGKEGAGSKAAGGSVAYCGSGITACVLVLAAEVAGLDPVRLYPGSWSEWSGRGLPVDRG
jgi:thiosulfate/3-mercaptopyruvate sulfurtransferase